MHDDTTTCDAPDTPSSILRHADAPPLAIPNGHVGPFYLPGSGRLIWWTGRVAIGLRHERPAYQEAPGQSALWVQDLMLRRRVPLAA